MNITKTMLALVGATLMTAGAHADDPSITLHRVQQRYPWNGLVDIDYTVANVPEPANYFVKFTLTAQGTNYVMHEMLDASTLINASNGSYRVTWIASADGLVGSDHVRIFVKNSNVNAQLIYSGDDKSKIPYPYYTIIDVSEGSTAQRFPVANEWFSNTHEATNKYNTLEYKTNKIVLRKIHAGTFVMGSPLTEANRNTTAEYFDESQHEVTLTKDYDIGMFEITQKQWKNVMGAIPYEDENYPVGGYTRTKGDDRPNVFASYQDIRGTVDGMDISKLRDGGVDDNSFLGVLRAKTGLDTLDLPTEAQMEYAIRAGTTTRTYICDDMDQAKIKSIAWCSDNADTQQPVGQKLPNGWGLYDMIGNVWEMARDRFGNAPPNDTWGADAVTDPLRAESGNDNHIVVRGTGFWTSYTRVRSAGRYGHYTVTSDDADGVLGFRLSRGRP